MCGVCVLRLGGVGEKGFGFGGSGFNLGVEAELLEFGMLGSFVVVQS